jgi:DNA-binding MarR family transcriptional regulator
MSEQHYHASTYRAQDSIGYLIKRGQSMMMDVLEALFAERGFSFIHYVILTWVRDGIAVNPKDICTQYRHDSGALTRVIDQLEERGLLERVRRGNDRRKVELQLTEEGRKTVEILIPLVVDKLNLALADFSREEAAALKRLLLKLNTRLAMMLDPKTSAEVKAAHFDPRTSAEAKAAHFDPRTSAEAKAAHFDPKPAAEAKAAHFDQKAAAEARAPADAPANAPVNAPVDAPAHAPADAHLRQAVGTDA